MDGGTYILAGLMIGVLGFLWTIHRDMRGLSDRMTRDVRDLSDRMTKDVHNLSDRVAKDIRGLSDRVARLEGLLERPAGRGPAPGE